MLVIYFSIEYTIKVVHSFFCVSVSIVVMHIANSHKNVYPMSETNTWVMVVVIYTKAWKIRINDYMQLVVSRQDIKSITNH